MNTKNTGEPKFIMSKAKAKDMQNLYNIDKKLLGEGSYGKVFKAFNKKDKTIEIAIKAIAKAHLDDDDLAALENEVAIMQKLDHPNIVKYFETYDDKKYIYLCMELMTGGELFDFVVKQDQFTEKICAEYMINLVKALQHCHGQGIIHRDIKPENIMLNAHKQVKFIDFGLAVVRKNKGKSEMEIAGTPYYIAPEVLSYKYGKECDIWSLGICIYQLLSGKMPFNARDQDSLFTKIKAGNFEMPSTFSPDLKDLLNRMIEVNPKKRITAEEIVVHPWMTKNLQVCEHDGEEHHHHSEQIVNNLKQYRGQSLLKQTVLSMVVKQLAPQEIEKFKHMFEEYDKDNSGFLTKQEIKDALKEANVSISIEELDKIVDQLDVDNNDMINYTEFLSASMDLTSYLTKDKIKALFATFDIDGSGEITKDNIQKAFSKFGREITQEEIDTIMQAHDQDAGKTISLDEFEAMFGK